VRAVGIEAYGGPECVAVLDLPRPRVPAGHLLVRVLAATVNPTDVRLRRGLQEAFLHGVRPPYVPGMELSGTVIEAGETSRWAPGDRVIGVVSAWRAGGGAQAEMVAVPEQSLTAAPRGMPHPEAATLPMNALTALVGLRSLGLRPGETLAVIGGAGAVGGYAVELARHLGSTVIAVARPADARLVKSLGADFHIASSGDTAMAIRQMVPRGVDAVLDAANLGLSVLPAIRDEGRLACMYPLAGSTERGITAHHVFVPRHLDDSAALNQISSLATAGDLTPRVADVLSAERVTAAHRALETGGLRGRLVLDLS
jgi:NADPH:quinone reductase